MNNDLTRVGLGPFAALTRHDTTSTALLDVAEERRGTYGFAGASIRDLAADVGIKKSSVYSPSSSKRAMLRAHLEHVREAHTQDRS